MGKIKRTKPQKRIKQCGKVEEDDRGEENEWSGLQGQRKRGKRRKPEKLRKRLQEKGGAKRVRSSTIFRGVEKICTTHTR